MSRESEHPVQCRAQPHESSGQEDTGTPKGTPETELKKLQYGAQAHLLFLRSSAAGAQRVEQRTRARIQVHVHIEGRDWSTSTFTRHNCVAGALVAEGEDGSLQPQLERQVSAVGRQSAFIKLRANVLKMGDFY